MTRPQRVAVITGGLLSDQFHVWREVQRLGTHLTVIGADLPNQYEGQWPWSPGSVEGLETIGLPVRSPRLDRGPVWWSYRGLGRTLRELEPDLVHVLCEPWALLTLQTLRGAGTARIATPVVVQSVETIYSQGGSLERALRRQALRYVWPRINAFVGWSQRVVLAAEAHGLPPSTPRAVIPAVVPDPARFEPPSEDAVRSARGRWGIPMGVGVVGYVGRLLPEKGVLDVLGASAGIASKPYVAIWGAGPLETAVAHELADGSLVGAFLGALDLGEVAQAMQACDVLVVPSLTTATWEEQFGRVVVEGMLTGRCVIAYGSGAIPEVLGDTGILVQEGNVDLLRDAIAGALTDVARRRDLGRRARVRAMELYHPAHLAQEVVRIWTASTRESRPAPASRPSRP